MESTVVITLFVYANHLIWYCYILHVNLFIRETINAMVAESTL